MLEELSAGSAALFLGVAVGDEALELLQGRRPDGGLDIGDGDARRTDTSALNWSSMATVSSEPEVPIVKISDGALGTSFQEAFSS